MISRKKKVAIVIKPRPPIWIITRMTHWPKSDQWVKVSTVTRPVTHVALVAVKSASRKVVVWPSFAEKGIKRSSVPTVMMIKKPREMT